MWKLCVTKLMIQSCCGVLSNLTEKLQLPSFLYRLCLLICKTW